MPQSIRRNDGSEYLVYIHRPTLGARAADAARRMRLAARRAGDAAMTSTPAKW